MTSHIASSTRTQSFGKWTKIMHPSLHEHSLKSPMWFKPSFVIACLYQKHTPAHLSLEPDCHRHTVPGASKQTPANTLRTLLPRTADLYGSWCCWPIQSDGGHRPAPTAFLLSYLERRIQHVLWSHAFMLSTKKWRNNINWTDRTQWYWILEKFDVQVGEPPSNVNPQNGL